MQMCPKKTCVGALIHCSNFTTIGLNIFLTFSWAQTMQLDQWYDTKQSICAKKNISLFFDRANKILN
jgi:hypothetical protein